MLDRDPVHLIVLVDEFGDADANPQGKQKNDTKIDINPNHLINGREIKAQTNYVVQVEKGNGQGDYLYTGDLWSSAPDDLKSHDIQYWSPPLEFDDSGNIYPMHFVEQFTVDLD